MQALLADWLRMENVMVLTAAGMSVSAGGRLMVGGCRCRWTDISLNDYTARDTNLHDLLESMLVSWRWVAIRERAAKSGTNDLSQHSICGRIRGK
jgi:hypothetical protein